MSSIRDILHAKLFNRDAPFFFVGMQTIKRRGQNLVARRIGQQIPGQLFNHELVIGFVISERRDHPITVRPNVPRVIALIAVRIRIPCDVQPLAGQTFGTRIGGHQPVQNVNISLLSIGAHRVHKRVQICNRRRQSRQIKRDSPQPLLRRRINIGRHTRFVHRFENEFINLIAYPFRSRLSHRH